MTVKENYRIIYRDLQALRWQVENTSNLKLANDIEFLINKLSNDYIVINKSNLETLIERGSSTKESKIFGFKELSFELKFDAVGDYRSFETNFDEILDLLTNKIIRYLEDI